MESLVFFNHVYVGVGQCSDPPNLELPGRFDRCFGDGSSRSQFRHGLPLRGQPLEIKVKNWKTRCSLLRVLLLRTR